MARGNFFRTFRIGMLLLVLFFVGIGTWYGAYKATSWKEPLWTSITPINGDGLATTQRYIDSLTHEDFTDIEGFMRDEAERYGVAIDEPVKVDLVDQIDSLPPPPPRTGNVARIALWSLSLRLWAWRHDAGNAAHIRVFVIYYDPAQSPRLAHSLGIPNGRIGVVNAFAKKRMQRTNNFVILHEMLHTLGATDKYEAEGNYPRFPEGFAEPEKKPLYPQQWAEIMAGRIPVDARTAEMPVSLDSVLVGDHTAAEIRWID